MTLVETVQPPAAATVQATMSVTLSPPSRQQQTLTSRPDAGVFQSQALAGWRWRQHNAEAAWTPCAHKKPVTEIFIDLLDAKRIPDPFLDENEKLVQWVGEADWEYECDFVVPPGDSLRQDLVFDGLDTFCSVFVNDKLVLESSNMFHCHRVPVAAHTQPGTNVLRLVFRSAYLEGRALQAKLGERFCSNGDRSRVYVRKAQYHYGWDWGPILLSCGPYREIRLETYRSMVYDVYPHATLADDLQQATLDVTWSAALDQDVSVHATVTSPSGAVLQASSQLAAADTAGKMSFSIERPELWYPIHHGPQVFYSVALRLLSATGAELHAVATEVGIRRVRLVQRPLVDQPGTTFFFEINNQPVFVSGSNWIPRHSFLTASTAEDYAADVDACVEGNQNMLRIWGGGVYEPDAFYKACDRRGILVWQDFMFACGVYPCYPEFAASVRKEAADQVKRLRQFCSIVLYAGNNEDYVAAEMLKLDWDPSDTSGDWTASNFPARTIYETYLPQTLDALAPGTCYHPGSPWGGKDTDDRTAGDIHQWNVWHGSQEKYQIWDKLSGRFVSEYGMLALPSEKTLKRCITDPSQRYPQSAVLDSHTKAQGAERRMALYVLENIRVNSMSLASWVYATQLIQSECLSFAVSSFRRQWKGPGREYCGGHLIWQTNDCWPCASWAMIDFYGDKKLSYYAVKRHSAALALGMNRTTPELKKFTSPPPPVLGAPHDLSVHKYILDLWASNSSTKSEEATVELKMFDIQTGTLTGSQQFDAQQLLPNQSTEILADFEVGQKTAVQALLRNKQGEIIGRASDWPQPLKHVLLPEKYTIDVSVSDGKVELSTSAPVKCVMVYLEDDSRTVDWEDNGVDLYPGDVYPIYARGLKKGDKVQIRYYGLD